MAQVKIPYPRISDTVTGPVSPRKDNRPVALDSWPGVIHTRFADVQAAAGKEAPWSTYITRDEVTLGQLINSPAGEGNHHHVHSGHDEWWVIMSGTTEFHLTGGRKLRAQVGDVVWVPRGTAHHVLAVIGASARLAVQMVGGSVYDLPECEICGRKWDQNNSRDISTAVVAITDLVRGPIPPRKDDRLWPGVIHTRPSDMFEVMGPAPWVLNVIKDERNEANLIADVPGGSNRPHYHNSYDEWWYIAAGSLEWHLTGGRKLTANMNDLVWVPRGTGHHIVSVGNEPSMRLAVTVPPAEHVWIDRCDVCGYAAQAAPN